ncbi:hypothetical protein ACIVBQ_000547 [Tenacibaculum discolor]
MTKQVSIKKIKDRTIVTVTKNNKKTTLSTTNSRSFKVYKNGVIVNPENDDPEFNNFYFNLEELTEKFGATTPEELLEAFADQGFFNIGGGAGTEQNNKIRTINLGIINRAWNESDEEAVERHINNLDPPIVVAADENVILKFNVESMGA